MARYSANRPNRALTVHKEMCHEVGNASTNTCGCGSTSDKGNSEWFCEEHITTEKVAAFMGERFWAVLLCSQCYRT